MLRDWSLDDLENGLQTGRPPRKLFHNCSGKHAGMLLACAHRGWAMPTYRSRGHPLQRRVLAAVKDLFAAEDADPLDGDDDFDVPSFLK